MGAVLAVSLEALTVAAREENRQAARKIAACYRVHCDWITRDTTHKHYSRYGRTEMALALGCSATVAESYVSVAVALHTRMPLLRAAFETGEIDLPRVRTACRILDNLSDDIVTRVEAEVVDTARQNPPGPLENAIWEILLRVAPEEAAALREFAKKFRTVTYSPAGELARIRAELTAPEAAAAWQLLEEMADTVCPNDPRGKKERLCDAFMARMHGDPHLVCQCPRSDCPKKDAVLPDRRRPLTMITVDIATLIGLLANPAYLAGHGSIDPDLARELARSSHWQILLTEAVTLAESLGLAHQNPDTGDWERTPKEEQQEPTPETATPTPKRTPTPTPTETETETESTSGRGTDTDRGSDSAPPHAASARGAAVASAPILPVPDKPAPDQSENDCTAEQSDHAGEESSTTSGSPPEPEPSPPPNPVNEPSESTTHPTSDTAAPDTAGGDSQRRTQSLTSAAALFCTHTPVGKGTRHSSALDLTDIRNPARNMRALDLRSTIRPDNRTIHTPAGLYLGHATLTAALEAAIAADPTLARSVPRDPLTDPALIYRPDALTTAAVRLRDKHCRFPGCHRPAARCQLDHIIAYDHTNPLSGGWSTVNNLQCLCEFHHSVKTAGYWKATMLPGGAILWKSTSTTTRITLPTNGTAVPILANDLRPHIPTTPRNSGIIAYPNPPDNRKPDNHEPETDETAPPF